MVKLTAPMPFANPFQAGLAETPAQPPVPQRKPNAAPVDEYSKASIDPAGAPGLMPPAVSPTSWSLPSSFPTFFPDSPHHSIPGSLQDALPPSRKTLSTAAPATSDPAVTATSVNGYPTIDLKAFLTGGSKSPAAIVIGTSEGNRTPSGGFNLSYHGHSDPGNSARNIGSFSYQTSKGSAMTPEQADKLWGRKLADVTPKYVAAAAGAGLDPNNAMLASNFYDLYTQSPEAATGKGGFLDQMSGMAANGGPTKASILTARMRSYVNPATGRLDAPGFGNNPARLRADQQRRMNAIESALKAQGMDTGAVSKAPGQTTATPNTNHPKTPATATMTSPDSMKPARLGRSLAADAAREAGRRGTVGNCYNAVADSVDRTVGRFLTGRHAYMAADQLAKHAKFQEVKVSPTDLKKLPAGSIVVWGKTNASPHGHISVALGDGREASDHIQKQITSLRGANNFRVFLPK